MSPSRRRAIARGGSPPRCVASHLALPAAPHRACLLARSRTPSETLKSPAVAHRLCAPIHPVPSLFVPLFVKNNRTSRRTPLRDFPSHPLITRAARWGHRALPPLRPQNSHTHYARAVRTPPLLTPAPRGSVPVARASSRAPAPRRKPSKSPAVSHRLCAPIHPVPSLFVPLCVKNNRTPRSPRLALRSCPVAVGRDVPVAPPRHRRGARRGISHFSHVPPAVPPRRALLVRPAARAPAKNNASGEWYIAGCNARAVIRPR